MTGLEIRDFAEEDVAPLRTILEDEWQFTYYSKQNGLDMAGYYLLSCVDGSNVSKVVLKDGTVQGILVIRDADGTTIDVSKQKAELLRKIEGDIGYGEFDTDMDALYGVYETLASEYKKDDWAELRLLIVSKSARGSGSGLAMIREAAKESMARGKKGLFFFTDTDCNVGFYDHLGAVRVGERTVTCMGVPLRVFGYYLTFERLV